MVTTRKKASLPAPAAAAPVPATVPQAPAPAKAVLAVPEKLPPRHRALAKKAAPAPIEVPQEPPLEAPGQPAPAPAKKTAAPEKPKKSKRVRDSFSMPKAEYAALDELKQRAALLQRPAKRSELLRAGIQVLAALPDEQFLAALAQLAGNQSGNEQ
jgi:hypothetical protein